MNGAFIAAFTFFNLTFPSKVYQQTHSGQQNRQNQNLPLQGLMGVSVYSTKAMGEGEVCARGPHKGIAAGEQNLKVKTLESQYFVRVFL